ncbi:MAG TPA: lipid-A-disaccharide synthase [Thermoanaerobaculia bacterium]|nr:lipid-A-disaccharide synthase [Thermoanaerobaculia bacterium]
MIPLLVVAGEASGDLHGARLLAAARRQLPDLAPFGLGGEELAKVGFDAVAKSSEIAVVGITEVARILRRARQIFHQLLAEVDRRKPKAAILIDSPDFNLRLARELRRRGVKVLYYISPQVWAWRSGRVETIRERVDRMWVLFSFEEELYRRVGVEVVWVGHPLVDEVPRLPQIWDAGPPEAGEPYRVALLPGSRRSEVAALFPLLLEATRRLAERLPIAPRLIVAPGLDAEAMAQQARAAGVELEIVRDGRFAALAASHLALCASGTATLEVGLLTTPLLVTYRVGRLTALLGRLLLRLPHISLVNLVLGKGAVPELLQAEARPETLAARAAELLTHPQQVAAMRADLALLRGRLGSSGAAERAAAELVKELGR